MTDATNKPPAETGEPVAWARYNAQGHINHLLTEERIGYAPLYTAPQPLAVGLDREAVVDALSNGFGKIAMSQVVQKTADAILALAAPAEGWRGIEMLTDAHRDGRWIAVFDKYMNISLVRWDERTGKLAGTPPRGWVEKSGYKPMTVVEYPGNRFMDMSAAITRADKGGA